MSQANKSTVLSSIRPSWSLPSGTEDRVFRVQGRSLSKAVNAMPASASKLILINYGGGVRMAAAHMPIPADDNKLKEALSQLALACDKTLIQVYTNEQLNQLTFKANLDNLPPLSQVWGPIMQLRQGHGVQKKNDWSGEGQGSTATAEVGKATASPAVDGKVEDLWSKAKVYELKNNFYDDASGPEDCSASFKTLWDKDNLYVLVQVQDEDLRNDSDEYWQDDAVEVFIDADNSKSDSYDDDDYTYRFDWDAASPAMGETKHNKVEGVKYAFSKTDKGYTLEVSFPWTTLGAKPSPVHRSAWTSRSMTTTKAGIVTPSSPGPPLKTTPSRIPASSATPPSRAWWPGGSWMRPQGMRQSIPAVMAIPASSAEAIPIGSPLQAR